MLRWQVDLAQYRATEAQKDLAAAQKVAKSRVELEYKQDEQGNLHDIIIVRRKPVQ